MASSPISANTGSYIGVGNTNLYTSPVGTNSMITKFTLTNTGLSAATVQTYLSDGATANATSKLQTLTVPSGQTITVQTALQHTIPPEGAILASASEDGLVIAKLSVVQFT